MNLRKWYLVQLNLCFPPLLWEVCSSLYLNTDWNYYVKTLFQNWVAWKARQRKSTANLRRVSWSKVLLPAEIVSGSYLRWGEFQLQCNTSYKEWLHPSISHLRYFGDNSSVCMIHDLCQFCPFSNIKLRSQEPFRAVNIITITSRSLFVNELKLKQMLL